MLRSKARKPPLRGRSVTVQFSQLVSNASRETYALVQVAVVTARSGRPPGLGHQRSGHEYLREQFDLGTDAEPPPKGRPERRQHANAHNEGQGSSAEEVSSPQKSSQ